MPGSESKSENILHKGKIVCKCCRNISVKPNTKDALSNSNNYIDSKKLIINMNKKC